MRIEAEKNNDNDGKALYKLMNNAICGKPRENLRDRTSKQRKRLFKMYVKTKLYVAQNI